MNGHRTTYAWLPVVVLTSIFAGFLVSQWSADDTTAASDRAVPATHPERRGIGAGAGGDSRPSTPEATRRRADRAASTPQAVPAQLLAVLHACMASPELRPPADAPPRLAVGRRLLEDCLRGSNAMDILSQLSSSLSSLEDADQEDAALLMAYLARRLLRNASTTAERAAILRRVLDGYRTVEGPHLREMTKLLLAQAYARTDDLRSAAQNIQSALERELEAGAVAHALGPLLRTSSAIAYPAKRGEIEQAQVPQDALDAMEAVADRAVPRAIDLSLGAMRSETQPYQLRDALLLLENALFASSRSYESQLTRAVPRILDALAELDLNRIRESGVGLRTLSSLLTQTELRLLRAGALPDLNEPPVGGETSPADLRRRWGMDTPQGIARNLLDLKP